MFTKESLVQFLAGAGCFSVIQMLLLVILGALFVSNEHYHQLLGNTIKHVGGGLIFTGLLYLLTAALGYYSARTQNKFLLLVQFVLLALLLFFQTLFGSIALGKAVPALPVHSQVACLTVGLYDAMTLRQQQECDQFLHSDAFAGVTLVWQSYYSQSLTKGSYRAMVLTFQKENFCCGNGIPMHCWNDTRAFPSSYPSTEISRRVQQRIKCDAFGTKAYAPTKDCSVNGRCDYDLPYGPCGLNPVTTTTRGCGAFMSSSLSNEVQAIGTAVLVALVFPVGSLALACFAGRQWRTLLLTWLVLVWWWWVLHQISFILASLCLCFKRRDEDVLPHIDFVSKVKIHAEG